MEKILPTLENLNAEAAAFVAGLTPQREGATFVTLSGELGAGKTAFVKAAAKELGVEAVVNSPTFVLEKIYPLTGGAFTKLVHIDVYRLEAGENLAALQFDDLMKDTGTLIMLEWPERVVEVVPQPAVRISLEALPDGSRKIMYA